LYRRRTFLQGTGCAPKKKAGKERQLQVVKSIMEAPHLSNFDRDDALVNIKDYRGCFAKDKLPRKMKKAEYPGTHWVAVVNDPKCDFVELFDPFGIIPSTEIHNYMKTANKAVRYNDNQLQDTLSVLCGYYCCF
jgi:hypothetical protein